MPLLGALRHEGPQDALQPCMRQHCYPSHPHAPLPPRPRRRSTLNGPSVPKRFRGDGKTVYRHSLRVWDLPNVTLASEFITGEAGGSWVMGGGGAACIS